MKDFNQNPKLFRELSEPFESKEKLQEALDAFADEITALRKKYKLANIIMGIGISCIEDGNETQMVSTRMMGDLFQCSMIAAVVANKYETQILEGLAEVRGRKVN